MASSSPLFSRGIALVIGVDGSPDQPGGGIFGSIDARNVAQALTDPMGCAFPQARVRLLAGREATTGAIDAAFDDLAKLAGPDDTVFLFIAAPGITNTDGAFHLQTADFSERSASKRISASPLSALQLARWLANLATSRVFVCLTTSLRAASRKGTIPLSKAASAVVEIGQNTPADILDLLAQSGPGRIVLCAASGKLGAYSAYPQEGSLFAQTLVGALRSEGNARPPGFLSAFDLADRVVADVFGRARELGPAQTPALVMQGRTVDFALGLRHGGDPSSPFRAAQKMPDTVRTVPTTETMLTSADMERLKVEGDRLARIAADPVDPEGLRSMLTELFDLDELKVLSSDMGIDPDSIPFGTIDTAAHELVQYCQRLGSLRRLRDLVQERRPRALQYGTPAKPVAAGKAGAGAPAKRGGKTKGVPKRKAAMEATSAADTLNPPSQPYGGPAATIGGQGSAPASTAAAWSSADLAGLRKTLTTRFSREDLMILCSELEVDPNLLRTDTVAVFAMELIRHSQRRNMLDKLESAVMRARPGAFKRAATNVVRTRAEIARVLTERFNLNEIEEVAFDLDVDLEKVRGTSRDEKARDLVDLIERNGRLADLAAAIETARPGAFGSPGATPQGGTPARIPGPAKSSGANSPPIPRPEVETPPPRQSSDAQPAIDTATLRRVLASYFTRIELDALLTKASTDKAASPAEDSDGLAAQIILAYTDGGGLSKLLHTLRAMRPVAQYELNGALSPSRLARILERFTPDSWEDVLVDARAVRPADVNLSAHQQALEVIDQLSKEGMLGGLVRAVEQLEPAALSDATWLADRQPRDGQAGAAAANARAAAVPVTDTTDVIPPATPADGPGAQTGEAGAHATANVTTLPNREPPVVVREFVALPPAVIGAIGRPAASIDTHTLDIHIGPTRAALRAEAQGGAPAEQDPLERRSYKVVMQLRENEGGAEQWRIYEGPLELPPAAQRKDIFRRLTGDPEYGRMLRRAVFNPNPLPVEERVARGPGGAPLPAQPALEAGFQWALARSAGPDEQLRIQLRIDNDAPELHALRWEYLWDETPLAALACGARTPFARILHVAAYADNDPPRIGPGNKLRMLVVTASPGMDDPRIAPPEDLDLTRLAAINADELKAIQDGLASHAERIEISTLALGDRPSLESLTERLRKAKEDDGQPFHVLHLICHGIFSRKTGQSYLVLHKKDESYAELVDETALVAALKPYGPGLRLTTLASCQGALGDSALTGAARALVAQAGAPAVIAMQGLVEFGASQHFAERLYERLANSGRVDVAINAARARLYELGNIRPDARLPVGANQWGLPALFTRVPDGRLFLIENAAGRANEPAPPTRARTVAELRGETPAESPRAAASEPPATQTIFGDPADRALRWALIQRARQYRQLPSRRAILFLRANAVEGIAKLIRGAPAGGPDAGAWRERVSKDGSVTLGGAAVDGAIGAGRPDGELCWRDAPGGKIALRTLDWRHAHRGFRPNPDDDTKVVDGPGAPASSGNLVWAEPLPGLPSSATLAALRRAVDPARLIREPALDIDEQTASLILHALAPDSVIPYRSDLAGRALAALGLTVDARYSNWYSGFQTLALDLLRDAALGFDNLADVFFFMQRAAAGYDPPGTVEDAPPNLRPTLADVALRSGDIDSELVFRETVLDQAVTALNAGKHIILIGPPGTGKTTLAEDICRLAHDKNFNRGHTLVTATADWTTFDTIGGYMPAGGDGLAFKPGAFLEAIEAERWLIIDEINRADIDKAFGELFTVLSGQPVTLPYREGPRSIRIVPPGHAGSATSHDYAIHPNWRIIGTMNVYDKASLFSMSLAFMRRFAFIDVALPGRETYRRLIAYLMQRRGLLSAGADLSAAARSLQDLAQLLDVGPSGENALMRHRGIGPAITSDILRYIALRCELNPQNVTLGHIAEAVTLYLIPQLDGLDQPRVDAVRRFLVGILPPAACRDLYDRLDGMYPHLGLGSPED